MSHPLPDALETGRFRLACLQSADREELFRHLADPRVTEFMDIDALTDVREADEIIGWTRQIHASATGIRWAVRQRDMGAFVGTCGFNSLELRRGRRGEIAYDLSPPHWGQGLMKEVLGAVLDCAFGRAGLERVEAFVNEGNARSAGLLAGLGFRLEGVLRRYGYWKGRFWDQEVYGLVRADWPPAHG